MQNISQKLESAFCKKADLDSRLKSASSSVLTQRIDFKESSKPHSSVNDQLKGKYVNLASSCVTVQKSPAGTSSSSNDGEGLPHPREIIFNEPLDYRWRNQRGSGFMNCGNTCFLNATLQCLLHTPPLTNYMMSGHHESQCRMVNRDKCILCSLQFLTKRSLNGVADTMSPKWFINNLQYIGRHFRNGRQEDAHEFLRLSLEKMQKCALIGHNHLDKYSKETTVINQIFGGFLRSQVICCKCGHKSNTYDPLLDISLDIKTANSIEQAFKQFVAPDKLEHENAYKCEKCKHKVTAFKRFTIHKAPNVLTIQLKRFQFGSGGSYFGSGSKLYKPVQYPMRLDIRNYMSHRHGPSVVYTLIGSIQHEGMSCNSGHYVANVRCGNQWYNFNDSVRRLRSAQQCLNESSAYILFYMREHEQAPSIGPALKPAASVHTVSKNEYEKKKQQNGNGLNPGNPNQWKSVNGSITKKNEQSSSKITAIPSNETGVSVKSPFVPLAANREKIRINLGVKPKTPEKPKASIQKPSTPRLVMKIKDGRSVTIETSPDGERKILSDDDEVIAMMNEKRNKKFTKKPSIVPYADDSDSDWSSKGTSPSPSDKVKRDVRRENGHDKNGPVLDGSLNTTTSVPGNAHLYNTVTMKDKVSHVSQHNTERSKELKFASSKSAHASPLKRQLSENLTCLTTPTVAKHSGIGEWPVTVENILSPSVASNHSHSSSHSNSSTNEWSVLSNKSRQVNDSQDRTHDGWTVTKDVGAGKVSKSVSRENDSHKNGETKREHSVNVSSSSYDNCNAEYVVKPVKPRDKNSEEYKLYKKMKKAKKHKKRRHHEREHNYSEPVEDNARRSHKKKKKKKHKHRDSGTEYEDVNSKPRERRETDREDEEHCKLKHDRETVEGSHKHRHREEDDHHHKRKHDLDEDNSHKRSRRNSGSSSEFEWVEKTVAKPVPLRTSKSEPVTPSRWDHHIKDGYKRVSSSGTSTPTVSSWDGIKATSVVQELEKVSSFGYGAPVSGWDGSRSKMDVLKDEESRCNKRKDSDDEYDDEYDRGKVKKVKHKHHTEYRHNGNLFQRKQDQINRSKINWDTIKIGDNSPYKHRLLPGGPQNVHTRF